MNFPLVSATHTFSITSQLSEYHVFWDIDQTLRSQLNVNRTFGETYRPKLQGRKKSQARYQHETRGKQSFRAGFLLCLFLEPEDGDDMFLRNVG
jgi:hypothetical protein